MVQSLTRKIIRIKKIKSLFKKRRDNFARKLRRQNVITYLKKEFKNSTTHGLPYIVNEEIHWFERLFWAIHFLACTALVFYLLEQQIERFIEAPTVMSVEMDYFNWNVSYPAFTLCPAPNFKVDVTAFYTIMNKINEKSNTSVEISLWSIILANIEFLDLLDYPNGNATSLIDPREYAKIAASAFKVFEESSITTNTNSPISVEPAMTELGMCHVVNSNVASLDNPIKWSNNVTTYTKNNIQLSVHDRDFFTQIINYAEIYKVFIHGSDEAILSTSPSYSQSLKGFMSFGVQVWSTKISEELRFAPMRLRKCRFISEPISERYPIYTYNHCLLECRIQMILKLCGCIPHFYKPLDYERVCSIDELKCVAVYKKEILSLSTSEKTLKSFKTSTALPRTSQDCKCVSQCETDVYTKDYENFIPQKDMNWLRIGISSFPKVRVVRDIIFSFYDIILRIGGVVNLCIGCSILSLVEICVTMIRLCFIS